MFQAIVSHVTVEWGLKGIFVSSLFETHAEACEWAAKEYVRDFCEGNFKLAAETDDFIKCNETGDGFASDLECDGALLDKIADRWSFADQDEGYYFKIVEHDLKADKKRGRPEDSDVEDERASKASRDEGDE